MSTLTISMPDEDAAFLHRYTSAQGISVEAFLARQTRNLREHLQMPLHPDVETASGIVAPEIVGKDAHLAHLENKHA